VKQTPENLVKKEIKDWLDTYGFFHFPLTQGLGCHPGLPDRIAIKDGHVLFIEIKAPKGTMSENQVKFSLNVLGAQGYYIIARGYEDIDTYCRRRGWLF